MRRRAEEAVVAPGPQWPFNPCPVFREVLTSVQKPRSVSAGNGAAHEPAWHSLPIDETCARLDTREDGLTAEEAEKRLQEHGRNALREQGTPSAARILLRQFKSVVIIVLVIAGAAAIAMQEWPESIAIGAVIVVNAAIGFTSEWRAIRSMEALRRLSEHVALVRRGGEERELPAQEIVPGDIVILRAEALVPADLRVSACENLQVNESALTGESTPVAKQTAAVDKAAVLSERPSVLHKGTTVVDGRGEGIVFATGSATEVGRVSELAQEANSAATPLQTKLDRLGWRMAAVVLITAAIIGAAGLLAGRKPTLMIETAIALGVAAIPEGLPIVATIAMAAGMWMMARRDALVNRLPAVETLGATRIICTDKTGTLTQNQMVVTAVVTAAGEVNLNKGALPTEDVDGLYQARRLIRLGVLCNGTSLGAKNDQKARAPSGDPLEIALLEAGAQSGILRGELLDDTPEVHRVPFDRETMMMATLHETGDGLLDAVKGAPQAVLDACDRLAIGDGKELELNEDTRREWRERSSDFASKGLRLLAFAEKRVAGKDTDPYDKLCLVGLAALHDPPREEVRDTINACQSAGIRVVMVTGDKPETAESIAEKVGIIGDPEDEPARVMHGRDMRPPEELSNEDEAHVHRANIFARVTPEQKLNLVQIYQDVGETVAMTGDGINDAPALKKADIGVAMGQRGTEAAKQVADMVLKDDALKTIVAAVEQGRIIFGNIRKAVLFMLCTNGAEVLAVAIAALLDAPLPLRPLQILYLNVLTDVFPALALAVGKGEANIMRKPPRPPDESVLTARHWYAIGVWSTIIAACVLGGLFLGLKWLGMEDAAAVTVSFLTLAFAKLWFVFNLRSRGGGIVLNEVTRNPWIWGAIALCTLLLLSAVYLPGLSSVLETRAIGWRGWGLALAASLIPFLLGQTYLAIRDRKGKSPPGPTAAR